MEVTSTSMRLFHATTKASAARILEEGLLPRSETGLETVYGSESPSMPGYVYLADQFTIYSIADTITMEMEERLVDPSAVLLEIMHVEPGALRPDEDMFDAVSFQSYSNVEKLREACSRNNVDVYLRSKALGSEDIHLTSMSVERYRRHLSLAYSYIFCKDYQKLTCRSSHLTKDLSLENITTLMEWLRFLWPLSLEDTGTVAHKGRIAPQNIKIYH